MEDNVYHTVSFNTDTRLAPSNSRSRLANIVNQNPLLLLESAVGRIFQILRYIEMSGPYIDKYGPVIKEVPTLYKVMKVLNELEAKEDKSKENKSMAKHDTIIKDNKHLSNLKLYI